MHRPYGALIEVAALTGLRWGELRGLRAADVVAFSGYRALAVTRSWSDGFEPKAPKSGKPRTVPLVPRAEELLSELTRGRRGGDLVFTAPRGGPIHGRNFSRSVKWDQLTDHVFHDLRHTAATDWIQSGVDPLTVSQWLGHSAVSTTLRVYAHWMGSERDLVGLAKLAPAANPQPEVVTFID